MSEKINLEEILNNTLEISKTDSLTSISKDSIYSAMLEFGGQLLQLAAENAYIQDWYEDGKLVGKKINKKSIIDTIKQVE